MNTVPNARDRELIIQNYISGYNSFDIDKMVRDLDPSIKFENILGGQSNMILRGLADLEGRRNRRKIYFQEGHNLSYHLTIMMTARKSRLITMLFWRPTFPTA